MWNLSIVSSAQGMDLNPEESHRVAISSLGKRQPPALKAPSLGNPQRSLSIPFTTHRITFDDSDSFLTLTPLFVLLVCSRVSLAFRSIALERAFPRSLLIPPKVRYLFFSELFEFQVHVPERWPLRML